MRALSVALAALMLVPALAETARAAPEDTAASVRATMQSMREQRAAADQERGGSLGEINEQRRAAAAEQAARRAARRRRSRGFPLFVMFREVGEGLFGEDGAVRGATTFARGLQQEVSNAARHASGPVGEIFEQVDKIRDRAIDIAKRPLRPLFDRTGQLGQLLEEFADIKLGDKWDSRMRRTGLGRTRSRIEGGASRLADRLAEISSMLDDVDSNRQDIDALWTFVSGIDNPRAREILRDLIEERLGVDFDEIASQIGADAARDNVRRGGPGQRPTMMPGVSGPTIEGRGRAPTGGPPMPRGPEGTGMRRGPR